MATKSKKGGKASKAAPEDAKPSKAVKASKKNDAGKLKTAKPDKGNERKRVSGLDAAAQVLKKAGKPMRARDLITAMSEQGLWKSPAGKTPWATLYSAMIREMSLKGKESRFKKVERGQFAFNKEAAA